MATALALPDDVLLLIADRIRSNIRDLEGCLVRLMAVASLTHQEITVELAEEVLQHYVNPEPDQMTPERIVASGGGAVRHPQRGAARPAPHASVAMPRQVAMFLRASSPTCRWSRSGACSAVAITPR